MAQDRTADSISVRGTLTQYYSNGKPLQLPATETMDHLATLMGAGWTRDRVQAATRDECIR